MLGAIIGCLAGSSHPFGMIPEENFPMIHSGADAIVVPYVFSNAATFTASIRKLPTLNGTDKALFDALRETLQNAMNESVRYPAILSFVPIPQLQEGNERKLSGGKGTPDFLSAYNAARAANAGWVYDSVYKARISANRHARLYARYQEELDTAEMVACVVCAARMGMDKESIRNMIRHDFGASCLAPAPTEELYPTQWPDATCKDCAAQALACFFASDSFESAIRLSERCGGTLGVRSAIAGAIAEAYYGIPDALAEEGRAVLPECVIQELSLFDSIRKGRKHR